MADKRDILIRLLGEETVSRMADRASGGLDKFGDSLEATEKDAEHLDRQIADVEDSLKQLAVAFARTSDAADRIDITKAIRRQQAELRKLTKSKDWLPDFDNEETVKLGGRLAANIASGLSRAGGPISAALSNVFGTLPPQAQAAIGAGLVVAVTAAAPAIGGVLAGAVTGAAGAGGILGGIAIASRHPAVKAAAKLTGDTLMRELERGAVSFVPATVESLGIIRSEFGEIGEDLERAFSKAAPMLEPLTRDVLAGAEAAVEGFATAVERSGPVVRVLGDIVEQAGGLIGDTFVQLSESAYEGGRAVAALWGVFEFGTRTLVGTVSGLAEAYGLAEKFGALLIGDRDKLVALIVEEHNAKQASGELSGGMQDLLNAVEGFGGSAATATVEVESLNEALKRLTGENISAENANIRLEEAINRATEAGKANNAGITANTPKALANRQALIGIAEAANASAEAILTQTGSQELASIATTRGRAKFIEAAIAMGVSRKAAIAYADKLFAIPPARKTKITQPGMQSALSNAKLLKQRIDNIDRRINIHAKFTTSYGGGAHTGQGYSTGYSEGGYVDGPGPKGIDSKPAMLAPGEGVLTADEVDRVGGPAGFERLRAAIRGGGSARVPAMAGAATAGGGGGGVNLYATFNVSVSPTANLAEVGRQNALALDAWARANGISWRQGR